MTNGLPPVVILSTADFASDVWTNKQHLAVGLARHTHVTYIESFGLRAPRPRRSDLRRVMRRFRARDSAVDASNAVEGIDIVRPVVIPFHGIGLARAINSRLVGRLPLDRLSESVLWTFSPLTYGLEHYAKAVVYHSVDLLHTQPGVPSSVLLRAERGLLETADRVLASSTGVRDHLQKLGRGDVELWENVADTGLFGSMRNERRPRAVFAGNLTPSKIDASLLLAVAAAGVDVVIAGPGAIDGTTVTSSMRQVLQHPHVTYLGTVSPERLAEEFSRSMVGLIPYQVNNYTVGVFPLKVYEYLAAGLQVVSTPLPSLADLSLGIIVPEPNAFATAVRRAIETFDEESADARRASASQHSWERRIPQAVALLDELRNS